MNPRQSADRRYDGGVNDRIADSNDTEPSDGERIDAAFEAIEQDDPETALRLATSIHEGEPLRYVIAAAVYLKVDDLSAAREAMDQADELELPLDDLDG